MSEINEVETKDSVDPVSIEKTSIILKQMGNCVCKIHLGGNKGTGFFIKIPYKNDFLKVLITNNSVLNEEKIAVGKNITISLNNERSTINIIIDDTTKIYTNEILDITIIELKNIDKINYFLTLDNQIINAINSENGEQFDYFDNIYGNESIYILNYFQKKYN